MVFKVIKCVGFGGLEFDICLYFFLCPSEDPIVSSLVKHKEFDELVHWHSHRPLSDDYDRTKANFNGELAVSAKLIEIHITLVFISKYKSHYELKSKLLVKNIPQGIQMDNWKDVNRDFSLCFLVVIHIKDVGGRGVHL